MTDNQVHLWPQDSHPHALPYNPRTWPTHDWSSLQGSDAHGPIIYTARWEPCPRMPGFGISDMLCGGHRLVMVRSLCQRWSPQQPK